MKKKIILGRQYARQSRNYFQNTPKSFEELKSTILASQYFVPGSMREGEDSIKQNQTNYSQIENGMKIFKLHTKFLIAQISLTLALISHLAMLIGYFEACQVNKKQLIKKLLLAGFMIASFFSVIFSCFRYRMRNQIAQERRQQKTDLAKIVIEVAILLVQPYPSTQFLSVEIPGIGNNSISSGIHINCMLLLLGLVKVIFIARGMLNLIVPYSNPRQYRIAKIYGTINNYVYQVRCLFRQHPVATISILTSFCWFLFAYCFRVCQYRPEPNPDNIPASFLNCLQMAMQTMTTVGYGDIPPKTFLGGIISIISCFTGVIGTSLLVLSITTNLELGYQEERALLILKNMELKKQIKQKSAAYIRVCLWRMWTQFKIKQKISITIKQRQLRRQLRQLRLSAKNDLKESSRLQERMQEQFYSVGIEVQTLLNNCDQIILFCINKSQIVQGVLKDAQKGKEEKYRISNYKADFRHNQYSLVSKKRPKYDPNSRDPTLGPQRNYMSTKNVIQ